MSTSHERWPPESGAITLESVKTAIDRAEIARLQLAGEVADLHGSRPNPAAPVTLTVAWLRELLSVLDVLETVARRAVQADEVMQRVTPGVSLIDDEWFKRVAMPRPGPVELARVLPEAVDRTDFGLPPLVKGPGYVEPPQSFATKRPRTYAQLYLNAPGVSDSTVEPGREKEDLKMRLHSPRHGVVWVFAADYTRFRSWCYDHDINHLDKRLVAFPSPGLWRHWLQGERGFHYAWGHGYEQRADHAEFRQFIEELEARLWMPPGAPR